MNASPALRCSATLLLLILVSTSTLRGSEARARSCCLKTSNTKIQMKLLQRYVLQKKPLCNLKAIRFITVKNTTVCSDPFSPWAIRAREYLDRKQLEQPRGTSLRTPAKRPGEQSLSTVTNRTLLQV
ncbi:eotaxin [Electrophorus electricus]|uniref:eotaxin n=1 Tax=Electrophorus electricus TaxID=8005 RepID=UPI0015D0CD6A|nr:eotaxin [Electrophorus electricus]